MNASIENVLLEMQIIASFKPPQSSVLTLIQKASTLVLLFGKTGFKKGYI